MKKIVSVLLTVSLLLLCSVSFAAPSITIEDLSSTNSSIIFEYENDYVTEKVAELQEKGLDAFFAPEALEAAKTVIGADEIEVNEMTGIGAHDYDASMGDIRVRATFPTPYEKDEKVAVLIGIPGGAGFDWTVLEGIGVENDDVASGSIEFTVPSDLILKLEEGGALIAVINK